MKMDKPVTSIFIHSLFRTGSTYIWDKFRQNDRYCCYYEPFHQVMLEVNRKNLKNAFTTNYKTVNHPQLKAPYLLEYEKLLNNGKKGFPYFKKSFPFDEYCNTDENPDLKRYIDYLSEGAEDKIPVFQFNRSALRTRWFQANYANSLNIYLVRNPRDQWQSYSELYKRTQNALFFVMDLLISCLNLDRECFHHLLPHLPLFKYHDDNLADEIDFYRLILDSYSLEERYLISYYLWFNAFIENALQADFFININHLTHQPAYREEILDLLMEKGIDGIDFEDCKISEYSRYTLSEKVMQKIENHVQKMILTSIPENTIQLIFSRLSSRDAEYFQFSKKKFLEKNKAKLTFPDAADVQKRTLEKYTGIIFLLSEKYLQQSKENNSLNNKIAQKEKQISKTQNLLEQKEKYIRQILNSYTYKTGKGVLFPFLKIKRLLEKMN